MQPGWTATTASGGTINAAVRMTVTEADEPADEPSTDVDTEDATVQEPPEVTPQTEPEAVTESPEDAEARAREFELWKLKKAEQHRRTREFAFGVKANEQEKS